MEVITIQSEAFQQILHQLELIKTDIERKAKQAPFADPWLDNNEVCTLLKVSKRTLQTYRDEGQLAFSQIGSKLFYRASDIEEFLRKHYKSAFKVSR